MPTRHPVYTKIDQRSYDAYVKTGSLRELICAFVVDPDEAFDAYELSGVAGTPHSYEFVMSQGASFVSAAMETISAWALLSPGANEAMREIAEWSRMLSVWCACKVVRESLYLTKHNAPRIAVETTERWVSSGGMVPIDQLRTAYRAAFRYQNSGVVRSYAEGMCAESAGEVARLPFADEDEFVQMAVGVVGSTNAAISDVGEGETEEYVENYDANNLSLRRVIANACLTFPLR